MSSLRRRSWVMRDWTFYLSVVIPALSWSALSIVYSAWLEGLPTDTVPGSVESLALWVGAMVALMIVAAARARRHQVARAAPAA